MNQIHKTKVAGGVQIFREGIYREKNFQDKVKTKKILSFTLSPRSPESATNETTSAAITLIASDASKHKKNVEKEATKVPKMAPETSSGNFQSEYYFFGCCEDTLLPLSCLDGQNDEKSTPLRDRDRLGNDPRWVPGFLSRCS